MVGIIIDTTQLNRLSADLGRLGERAARLARVAIQKTAADIKADAQAFAPVDTGNLRSSITYESRMTADGAVAEIGPTAAYGVFVEFGTSRRGPAAFMGPAYDRRVGDLEQALQQIADLT